MMVAAVIGFAIGGTAGSGGPPAAGQTSTAQPAAQSNHLGAAAAPTPAQASPLEGGSTDNAGYADEPAEDQQLADTGSRDPMAPADLNDAAASLRSPSDANIEQVQGPWCPLYEPGRPFQATSMLPWGCSVCFQAVPGLLPQHQTIHMLPAAASYVRCPYRSRTAARGTPARTSCAGRRSGGSRSALRCARPPISTCTTQISSEKNSTLLPACHPPRTQSHAQPSLEDDAVLMRPYRGPALLLLSVSRPWCQQRSIPRFKATLKVPSPLFRLAAGALRAVRGVLPGARPLQLVRRAQRPRPLHRRQRLARCRDTPGNNPESFPSLLHLAVVSTAIQLCNGDFCSTHLTCCCTCLRC